MKLIDRGKQRFLALQSSFILTVEESRPQEVLGVKNAGHRTSPCWPMHSVNLEAWPQRKLQSHNATGVRFGLNVG